MRRSLIGGAVVAAAAATSICFRRKVSSGPIADGKVRVYGGDARKEGVVVLAGSFNPLHEGHLRLGESALKKVRGVGGRGDEVLFEIAVKNADKGAVDEANLQKRIDQFTARGLTVAITPHTLYVDKARHFKNSYFIVGYDTIIRILDDKYYNVEGALGVLKELHSLGACFIIAGRHDSTGTWCVFDIASHPVARNFPNMFLLLTKDEFCVKLSSTEIRAAGGTI